MVSPANSRKVLRDFLKRARNQLLIYDPQISDKEMIKVLQERAKAGVEVRIIGQASARSNLSVQKLTRMSLHARVIIRDGRQAFVGSQSLRSVELDSRRELGLIIREPKVLKKLLTTFDSDWATTNASIEEIRDQHEDEPKEKKRQQVDTEKALASLVEELHPVTATVKQAVRKVAAQEDGRTLSNKMLKSAVKKVVKKAVKQAVKAVERESDGN